MFGISDQPVPKLSFTLWKQVVQFKSLNMFWEMHVDGSKSQVVIYSPTAPSFGQNMTCVYAGSSDEQFVWLFIPLNKQSKRQIIKIKQKYEEP